MEDSACGSRQGSPSSNEVRDAAEAPQPQLLHLRPHATHEPWPRSPHAQCVWPRAHPLSFFLCQYQAATMRRCMQPTCPRNSAPEVGDEFARCGTITVRGCTGTQENGVISRAGSLWAPCGFHRCGRSYDASRGRASNRRLVGDRKRGGHDPIDPPRTW